MKADGRLGGRLVATVIACSGRHVRPDLEQERRHTVPFVMARAILPILFLLTTVLRIAEAQDSAQGLKGENHVRREDYFWSQRTYPGNDRVSAALQMQAVRSAMAKQASLSAAAAASGAAIFGGGWRAIGPTGIFGAGGGYFDSSPQLDAGRVTAVAPDPVAPGQLIIGTASGGVWSTTALGAGWTPLTDTQCSLNIGAVSVDPVTPSIVYVGTGERNIFSAGCGVLRSIDGGQTWTATGQAIFQTVSIGHILIDPATAGSTSGTILLAATPSGIYRSPNSGTTWVLASGAPNASSIIAHPTKAGVMFTGGTGGVYRSLDHGATWSALPPFAAGATIQRIELAVSPAAPNDIFALVANSANNKLLGLYEWDDSLNVWSQPTASGLYTGDPRGDFGGQAEYDLAIAIDPRDARHLYVAGVRAFVSADGGTTFKPMGMEIHCDWHAIVFDPRTPDMLYAGTDGGVFTSMDDGETWTSRNDGLAITQFYPGISIHPQGTQIFGGAQDNASNGYAGSLTWDGFSPSGDGGYTAINYANPVIHWAAGYWSNGLYIIRYDASGSSARATGFVPTDRAAFLPPLIMDPVTPTRLYSGTYRLYRTTNEGILWTPMSGDLTKGTGNIMTIAVAPSDTLTIYVGTSDGNAQVSRDGGTTFTRVTTNLPNRVVTRIAVDPANAAHAYLSVQGAGSGHVFETATAGATWADISGNLPNIGVNAIVIVPGTGVIMVGTDAGVYQSGDDGTTWQPGPAGLPNVIVQDLAYSATSNLLVAATFGRGMFAYQVGGQAAVLRGDVNADGAVNAFDALLIQQALISALPATTSIYPRGDANCNASVDAADVLIVLRFAVGLTTPNSCVNTIR